MHVRYVLLTLPVHRRSFGDYYREHDQEVAARREELQREWGGQSFEDLPAHIRLYWKDQWYWPPWFFNDTVGFIKLGSDGEASLVADVYLERRHFPPTALERFGHRGGDPCDEREVVYLGSTGRRPVVLGDNSSYVAACTAVVAEGRQTVRLQGHGLGAAEVWLPGFDLACYDLARADGELRVRFPGRTTAR
jgi:hypothetical protein